MKKTNETGRSMVEMLGVLAIIGVLSVGGIMGYTRAMRNWRANEVIAAVNRLIVVAEVETDAANANAGVTYNNALQVAANGNGSVTNIAGGILSEITMIPFTATANPGTVTVAFRQGYDSDDLETEICDKLDSTKTLAGYTLTVGDTTCAPAAAQQQPQQPANP